MSGSCCPLRRVKTSKACAVVKVLPARALVASCVVPLWRHGEHSSCFQVMSRSAGQGPFSYTDNSEHANDMHQPRTNDSQALMGACLGFNGKPARTTENRGEEKGKRLSLHPAQTQPQSVDNPSNQWLLGLYGFTSQVERVRVPHIQAHLAPSPSNPRPIRARFPALRVHVRTVHHYAAERSPMHPT